MCDPNNWKMFSSALLCLEEVKRSSTAEDVKESNKVWPVQGHLLKKKKKKRLINSSRALETCFKQGFK